MASLKDLIVSGSARIIGKLFTNEIQTSKINGVLVGDNPKFTDTTTAVSNVLTSDSTTEALSAAQGKVLKGLIDAKAAQGEAGQAATVTVGTVTTGAAGSSAAVTNSGSSNAAVFNFTIPKGDKGATGTRGSRWNTGNTIIGESATATVFSGSGITDALVGDMYLNTTTSAVYRCTTAGVASAAKWVYLGTIKGSTGTAGAAAGFGTPTATVDANVGTPSVTVTTEGNNTAKVFKFAFKNLKGATGAAGTRGSRVTTGKAITGNSTTALAFSSSGITDALVNDIYINTDTGFIYHCTVAGNAATAKWVYDGSLKGAQGSDANVTSTNVINALGYTPLHTLNYIEQTQTLEIG